MVILFIGISELVGLIVLCAVFLFFILKSVKKQKILTDQLEILNQKFKSNSEYQRLEIDTINEESKKRDNLSEFKGEVIDLLLHDLKNPLNLLLNHELISKELLGHAANQMLNIVTTIGDVQKYEKTKMHINFEGVYVLNIINDAYNQVESIFKQKRINYTNQINKDLKVYADKNILERIFVNLFLNAEKFSQPGGEISIKSDNQKDKVVISIIDSGYNVPDDLHKLIFDKYGLLVAKKSNPTRSGNLGLCFCKLAMDAHDEKIGVKTYKGKTAFWFTLKAVKIYEDELRDPKQKSDKRNELSDDSKILLKQSIKELKLLKVYEFSAIQNIIKLLEGIENKEVTEWVGNLKLVVKSGDEDEYNDLIKRAE